VLALSAMTVAVLLSRFIFDQFDQMVAQLELEQQVADLANRDALTGLLNRRGFEAHLEALLADTRTPAVTAGIIDLDGFKQINDRLGHFAGDEFLTIVAARVAAVLPAGAIAGRFGGDEFVFALPAAGVAPVIGAMLRELCRPATVGGEPVPMSASIGHATAPADAENAAALLAAADVALYAAKHAGKSRARGYTEAKLRPSTISSAA
jgi:diguanylate cyclase (GGDEF)-like protein